VAYLIGMTEVGGTEKHLLELLRGIDRVRFEPIVICILPGGSLRGAFSALSVPVIDLALRKSYSFAGIGKLLKLARELRNRRIDVLHAYQFHGSLYACLVAPLCGSPKLLVSERGKRYRGWHRRLARTFFYRRAERILINCEALRDYVRECCPSDAKIMTIPNGVDCGLFRPNGSGGKVRAHLNLPALAPVIGSVGRLQEVKGHRYLVEAFVDVARTHPEAHLLLVGGGPGEKELRSRLRDARLEDRAHFVGDQADVRPYLEAMDFFVLPSLSEAHSMALLEAMAMGKPVLATSIGGNRETVQTEVTGLLVPPASAEALGGALLRLMSEPRLASRLGHEARRAAARYDWKEMVRRYENLYGELEADPPRAGDPR